MSVTLVVIDPKTMAQLSPPDWFPEYEDAGRALCRLDAKEHEVWPVKKSK